jgi:hypothetical protein
LVIPSRLLIVRLIPVIRKLLIVQLVVIVIVLLIVLVIALLIVLIIAQLIVPVSLLIVLASLPILPSVVRLVTGARGLLIVV